MFSLATCHEIKTLSKTKNATNAATLSLSLSPNQCPHPLSL
jgi:hypothetical protein